MAKLEKLFSNAPLRAKPKNKNYTISDGGGLSLLIKPNASKLWRYNYRYRGKQKTMALGSFPEISLANARAEHKIQRMVLAEGKDPMYERKIQKVTHETLTSNAFKTIAEAWIDIRRDEWSSSHLANVTGRLKNHVYPLIGDRLINELQVKDMLVVLRTMEKKGIHQSKKES